MMATKQGDKDNAVFRSFKVYFEQPQPTGSLAEHSLAFLNTKEMLPGKIYQLQ